MTDQRDEKITDQAATIRVLRDRVALLEREVSRKDKVLAEQAVSISAYRANEESLRAKLRSAADEFARVNKILDNYRKSKVPAVKFLLKEIENP